jgi:cytochrome P450
MNPNGEYMKDSEIWAEAAFFFPAGADTVSTLVCATLFYLAHNPREYKGLADEIHNTFATGSDIRGGADLSNCKYLRACLDETLRMSSPAPGTFRRELDPNDNYDEPIIVDGHIVPRGAQIGVNMYSILHDAKYFSDPFVYYPDQWIEEGQKPISGAFVPLSVGPRNCAGKTMAYSESSLLVARLSITSLSSLLPMFLAS